MKKKSYTFSFPFSGLEIITYVESVTKWNRPKWTRLDYG